MHNAVNSPRTAGLRCPGCLSPTGPGTSHCPTCGIWLAGPQVAELRCIDSELTRVDVARTRLISRRAALLDELTRLARQAREAAATKARPSPGGQGLSGPALPPPQLAPADAPTVAASRQRPEISGRTAARLLLAAGATLVAIAIAIFTIADWARIGPLGRCAILLAVTGLVLVAPRPVARRGLDATAESVAGIGLVLTLGDAFLIQRFAGLRPGALAMSAFCAAMAIAWAAYGAATGLRVPRLAALGLAQLSAPFALAGVAGLLGAPGAPMAGPIATGLIVSAACDIVLAGAPRLGSAKAVKAGNREWRRASAGYAVTAAATATWTCGVLLAASGLALGAHWRAAGAGFVARASIWLALAFAAAAVVGVRGPSTCTSLMALARPAAVISGALAALSLAIPASALLPANWGLAVIGACGFCIIAASLTLWPTAARGGPDACAARRLDVAAGAAAILATVTALIALPAALVALIPPNSPLSVWAGEGRGAEIGGDPLSGPHLPGATALLALCALACMLLRFSPAAAPARFRPLAGALGIGAAALAAGSLPAAAHLSGWAALLILTVAAAILLVVSTSLCEVLPANIAALCGGAIAATAAWWSLAAPATTIAELSALAAIFALAALRARHSLTAALATIGVLAAIAGLAWAVPLAAGRPAADAAFAALGVAVTAVAVATILRRTRPVHSVVLDLGAVPIALAAAIASAGQQDMFAILAVAAAIVASGTAWFRTGRRRVIALLASAVAVLAALAALGRPVSRTLVAPVRNVMHPWQGQEFLARSAHFAALPLAVVVLAASLAALVSATGAWKGNGRTSLDALALALPLVAAPAGQASLNGGLAYLAVVAMLLALTLGLTAWAGFGKSHAPAGAALISAALTIAWALAAPLPTLTVLGCMSVGYGICAWRSPLQTVRVAATFLSVLAAAAFAESLVFAAGLASWQAGLAALTVAAGAQLMAALLARHARRPLADAAQAKQPAATAIAHGLAWPALQAVLAIEVAGWLVMAAGVGQCLARPGSTSAATAIAGITSVGVAARADRRPALWAGLALCYAAWCTGLAAIGAGMPELYTAPAAFIAIAAGWKASRQVPRPHSWLAYGPGLTLLLVPSLVMAWDGTGWIRPVTIGVAAIGIAIMGAWMRTQAPLLAGTTVAVLVAARGLAPDLMQLMHAIPGWVPAAIGGAALLWAGATYEARLGNLRAIRRSLASMS